MEHPNAYLEPSIDVCVLNLIIFNRNSLMLTKILVNPAILPQANLTLQISLDHLKWWRPSKMAALANLQVATQTQSQSLILEPKSGPK